MSFVVLLAFLGVERRVFALDTRAEYDRKQYGEPVTKLETIVAMMINVFGETHEFN